MSRSKNECAYPFNTRVFAGDDACTMDYVRKIRFYSIRRSTVGPRVLQGVLHFRDCYDAGIVVDGVDLFKTAKAFCNLFDTFQPLQGCLTDIISCNKENGGSEITPLGVQHAETGEHDQPQDYTGRKGLNESRFYLNHGFSPLICRNNSLDWLSPYLEKSATTSRAGGLRKAPRRGLLVVADFIVKTNAKNLRDHHEMITF